ncbi:MAG: TolC family protein [Planctomycetes bacterium]|nr:TolC family protein [Planctomycetota bacterium]
MSAQTSGARRALPYCAPLLALLGACAAPEPRPLDLAQLASDVTTRGATSEQVARALELADLRALSFERPTWTGEPDYDRGAFWQASALAFNGELRAARRRWAEASARARSGGAPAASELEVEQTGFSSGERDTWLAFTFDVLGLLDAGRAAAARELTESEARAAWSAVEGAAWDAHIAVERARADLGDTLAKIAALDELLLSAEDSLARAELLFERGRLSAAERARLQGLVAEVGHELHQELARAADGRRALADAAGLPPGAPALARPTLATLTDLLDAAELLAQPSALELLERSPQLRRARLEYAVAEAMLRDEVAESRPGLRLGPALQFTPADTLPGGVLVLDLPHGLSGRVEAARQARERAREELEEALRANLTRQSAARERFRAARAALADHAAPRERDTEIVWRAARARFAVEPAAAEELGMALRDRAMALTDLFDVRSELVTAWLDLGEAIGPPARPLPGDEALARSTEAAEERR